MRLRAPAAVHPQRSLFDEPVPATQAPSLTPSLTPSSAPSSGPSLTPPLTLPPSPASTAPRPVPSTSSGLTASTVAVASAPLPLPAVFRHPQAQREIQLNGQCVAYALRRARRRSIGFVVGIEGLSVSAPRWVGIGEIESALQEKAGWIIRKLGEQHERHQRLQAAKIEWRDGTQIPYLGEILVIRLGAVATAATGTGRSGPKATLITPITLNTRADAQPGEPRHSLHIPLPPDATAEHIRAAVQAWLQVQARRIFEARCRHFAPLLGVAYTRLSLSSAQTRWGSASATGRIRLNWRLIHLALPSIDYVVAHELSHLREMNHSPRFWEIVRSVMPDYELVRGALKDDVLPVFD